jgi:NRAMP (natural resistance-associated macrophage protein)-like metal ion transporter
MLLSVLATIVLQEMAARVGLVTGQGLTHVLREQLRHRPLYRAVVLLLILCAVVVGNAAYEAGNISGGRLGLETLLGLEGQATARFLSLPIGAVAFVLLYQGSYRLLERALILLVLLMSLSFLVTALLTRPDPGELLRGLLVPALSDASLLTVVGLIGTTVVPYNLFLHTSLVAAKWQGPAQLRDARRDTVIAVAMGGLVSMSIIVSAAAVDSAGVRSGADLALSLEPLFGEMARYLLGIGLFAAGITSAITAPLAAAYVTSGCLGWGSHMKHPGFRATWMGVLALGVLFSSLAISPIEIIRFAQVANGIALPVVVGVLLWLMNRESVLGTHINRMFHNVTGGLIFIFTVALGWRALIQVVASIQAAP